jgi:cell division protein FtsW (lipid II flippase)
MSFVNQNSFILLGLFIWVVALAALRQRGWEKRSWLILGVLTAVLIGSYFFLRPAQATRDQAAEIRARIGQGKPVLLMFQSEN